MNVKNLQNKRESTLSGYSQKEERLNLLLNHNWLESTLASLVSQMVKNPPAMQDTQIWSLGWEDSLEKGMRVFLCGETPWTEKPDGLQSTVSQRVEHNWVTKHTELTYQFFPKSLCSNSTSKIYLPS